PLTHEFYTFHGFLPAFPWHSCCRNIGNYVELKPTKIMVYQHKNRIMKASSFKDTTVKNAISEKIGKVEDIMIDTGTGDVAYIILSVDSGFLNMGNKYFAIPWQAFAFDTAQDDVFILNVEKEKIKNAPGFEKDNWPTHAQNEFLTEVQTYYGFSKNNEPVPPMGNRTIDTIKDRDDRRDPNPKQTNFI